MDDWRKVIAALANDKLRIVFAELVLEDARRRGIAVSAGKRPEALEQLGRAGLVREGPELDTGVFRSLLRTAGTPRRGGVERFLVNGRIDQYPAQRSQRRELLAWIAGRAFRQGEDLSEKEVNERLKEYSGDYATLRRYLVDFELIERTRAGTSYSLVSNASNSENRVNRANTSSTGENS